MLLARFAAPASAAEPLERPRPPVARAIPNISIETIVDLGRLEEIAPEWRRLEASISPRLPFNSPTWFFTWWRHFRRNRLAARDSLRCYAMRSEAGELIGVAPMFLTERPGRGVFCARELQFFGADQYVTEWRGVVCQRRRRDECVRRLAAHIAAEGACDWVQWRGLATDEPLAAGRGEFRIIAGFETPNFFLSLPENWNDFRRRLPRNIKESLRKCYNSLAREHVAFELKVVSAPDETPEAVARFIVLHGMRARQPGAAAHADIFASPAASAFLSDFCATLAERGQLRVFQLVIAEKIVATRVGFVFDDELYLYYSGYDPAWARYSVMTTTLAEAIKWAIANRFRIVNLSMGRDVSKTRWRPDEVGYHGGYWIAPSILSRAAFSIVERGRQGKAARNARANAS